jgi:small subunit ribosomal protein S2
MSRTNFDTLLEAGCHFGHLKRKWNPAMAPYIFMERNGIHIIDLHKTVVKVDEAAEALKQIAKSGKKDPCLLLLKNRLNRLLLIKLLL